MMAQLYNGMSISIPSVAPMPGGSAIAVWYTLPDDIQAQGFDANLNRLWGSTSEMIAGGTGTQYLPQAVWDGADGAIVAWTDQPLTYGDANIYATRVDRFGAIGSAAPVLTKLADVPNDQGGFVSLHWTRSSRDVAPTFPIARYSIWRRAPGGLSALHADQPARVIGAGAARPEGPAPVFRAEPTAAGVVFWEYLSQLPARGYDGYSAVAPTTSDSVAGSNPRTSFRIEAEAASGIPYWDSAPDSAYSVDNLPPAAPAPFTGAYAAGVSTLAWQPNSEADFALYRLYRGTSPGFTPSPANLVAQQSSTGFSDPAGAPYWYKLGAVDVHGNASPYATLLPTSVSGVDGSVLPHELALAPAAPNPARGSTALRCSLPRACDVSLAVYDAAGRRVRMLASGAWAAGVHDVAWDARGDSGAPVGAGVYFVRFEAEMRRFERRVSIVR